MLIDALECVFEPILRFLRIVTIASMLAQIRESHLTRIESSHVETMRDPVIVRVIVGFPQILVGEILITVDIAVGSGAKAAYILPGTVGGRTKRDKFGIDVLVVFARKTFSMCRAPQFANDVWIVGTRERCFPRTETTR